MCQFFWSCSRFCFLFSFTFLVTSFKKSTFKGLISKKEHINRELLGGWRPLCPPAQEGLIWANHLQKQKCIYVVVDIVYFWKHTVTGSVVLFHYSQTDLISISFVLSTISLSQLMLFCTISLMRLVYFHITLLILLVEFYIE